MSFGSELRSPQMNVVSGDFNSHTVDLRYKSTDKNVTLVERLSESNKLPIVHDAKQPKSFHCKRWRQDYRTDLAFVSDSVVHQAESL